MNSLYKEFKVNNGLEAFIDCVWKDNHSSYLEAGENSFLVVPDNTVELVFTSNPIKRQAKSDNKSSCTVRSHLCGLKTKPQIVTLEGDVLLSVRIKPYGLHPFTDVSLNETIDQSLNPEDIFGKEILNLEASLFNCKDELMQIKLIESFFSKKLIKHSNDEVFDFFIANILMHKGNINIKELSESVNISKKTIERIFLRKLGLTPKKYCRIVRLFYALKIPKPQNNFKFSSIAFDNGFYDQAHFIKEIKHYTGMTPKAYFKLDRTIQKHIFSH
ncbi:AraC family transcriptional regulator [uncultured Winogradskyella sp.]|uniref:helix-turn-helix domain-containing protein n=1 Tax=uncultured Winogradskyella sp. TaxID=395353 RepID=UPI0026347C45|nr:AraC family transcriptional regulator [uncultured Winogradskyella sp.]